jgi:hypothetical protein
MQHDARWAALIQLLEVAINKLLGQALEVLWIFDLAVSGGNAIY